MVNNFKIAFEILMQDELRDNKYEAVVVKGEEFRTIAGITEKYYPNCPIWDMLDAPQETLKKEVSSFYYNNYFKSLRLHLLNKPEVAIVVLNLSVLFGKRKVTKMIQRILGCKQDGIFGDKTFTALARINDKEFVYEFLLEGIQFINYLANAKYKEDMLGGWLNRIVGLFTIVQRGLRISPHTL